METGCEGGHICLLHVKGPWSGWEPGMVKAGFMCVSVCVCLVIVKKKKKNRDATKIENVEFIVAGKSFAVFICYFETVPK